LHKSSCNHLNTCGEKDELINSYSNVYLILYSNIQAHIIDRTTGIIETMVAIISRMYIIIVTNGIWPSWKNMHESYCGMEWKKKEESPW